MAALIVAGDSTTQERYYALIDSMARELAMRHLGVHCTEFYEVPVVVGETDRWLEGYRHANGLHLLGNLGHGKGKTR